MARGLVEGCPVGFKQLVIDAWSWLNYKPVFSDPVRGMPYRRAFPESTAMWVPEADQRRLAAYKLLAAYDNNQAGELAEVGGQHDARERREYGDPSMFIDALVANVLGREQHIVVPGAEGASDTTDVSQQAAEKVQGLLREWAEAELLAMRMQQVERKAVGLGDGVYRLAWDPGKTRVTLRAHDPGFYFPVLPEDGDAGDFPTRVHFAWELPADPARGLKARIRRITYEIGFIGPATAAGVDEKGRAVRAPLPVLEQSDDDISVPAPPLGPGDVLDPATGSITRPYPWNDQPSALTCYLTDATWVIGDLKGVVDVDTLPLGLATFATRADGEVLDHLDLLIDFIPVVHVPNTVPPAEEHWGQPSLAKVLQVFDELSGSDTDSARSSATTGLPMIGVWGKAAGGRGEHTRQVVPGMVWELGEGGGMIAVDTSRQLAELRSHTHDLQDRAASVARLPAVTIGTADPAQASSGYALQLTLGPLDSLIGSMRLARDHKYALLLKFVQRLNLAGQHPDWAGVKVLPAKMVFGPYTPTDKAAVLDQVTAGVTGGVLSLETGVRMLMDAGFPVEDVEAEIERIQARQFEAAKALADATGDTKAVGDYLGLDLKPDPTPPPVVLPQLPGQQPQPGAPNNAQDPANPAGQGNRGNAG
ncbi:hypothetical protein ABZ829_27845 [Streptomyces xanthochromogenes]|uniref:hypothetical protein n=1 Tax=Streptomyces xanthochromogenes TaxID=67384 RepID=UPI003426BEF3